MSKETDRVDSNPVESDRSSPERAETKWTDLQRMAKIDDILSHIWMVRTFLKHSDESTDDEELAEVHRELYDYMLALGPAFETGDAGKYLHIARKKLAKLKSITQIFLDIQPEVSGHMNFRMAAKSLSLAVAQVESLLREPS